MCVQFLLFGHADDNEKEIMSNLEMHPAHQVINVLVVFISSSEWSKHDGMAVFLGWSLTHDSVTQAMK